MAAPESARICMACGQTYHVDESIGSLMDPPLNFRRGCLRYCLSCWLSVGPNDFADMESDPTESPTDASQSADLGQKTPCASELSKTFDRCFAANDSPVWNEFLERFGRSEGHICYYPSAGSDFRPLVYQQTCGMAKLGLVDSNGAITKPADGLVGDTAYSPPDLWILSDFRGDEVTGWLETGIVHRDERVDIRLLAHTEIHPRRMEFQRIPNRDYISAPPSSMTGRAFHLRLAITNATTGTVEADVLYFCVENVNLIRKFLLWRHMPLSHMVWVRDGSGFGGGRLRHDFLIPLLVFFKTRWLFISHHYLESLGQVRWPQEFSFHERLLDGHRPDLQIVGSIPSGDDRVVFCKVDSARVDEVVRMRRASLIGREIPQEVPPSVFLWLCCEGWMKFGPFEWLRFDDDRQAILGPDGAEVARKLDGQWRVPGKQWQDWAFSNPTITTTPKHPHKQSGSHPRSPW